MNPSEEKAKAPEKTKALCVATRCTTIDQFVATFHRFCDESSFFVATLATRPVGLETAFSIQLEDKTPVLRGLCVVVEAWSTPANRFGRPGVRLNVRRLTNESLPVFKQLQAARIAAEAAEKAKDGDAKPVEVAKIESKPVAATPVDAKSGDGASNDADPFDSKTADAKILDARQMLDSKVGDAKPVGIESKPVVATPVDAKPADVRFVDAKPIDAKPIDTKPIDSNGVGAKADSKPVAAKPAEIKPFPPKPPEKPKSLADKLAEIKSQPKPPAIPPRKTDGIPPIPGPSIPSAIPKINPTAFAVKPAPRASSPTPSIIVEIDEPTKIEAKTVRAEGTAPVTRAEPPEPPPLERPTPLPRASNVTTPAIGISTSTVNLSNAALTAEDTAAQAPSYPDTASIVDAPPRPDAPAVDTATPEAIAASDDMTSPVASESRAPGSSFILPANPLMNLTDKSIEGFVDCALYEETGNFARAPGYDDSLVDIDDVAAPPGVLSPTPAIRPGDEVSQAAYVMMPTPAYVAQQQFAQQEMTPVPVMGRNPTQPPYPTGQMQPYGQYPTGQMQPMQYPTGQMAPMGYPMQTGTTNPPYGMMQQQPPHDSTAALLAMSAPNRRRWMIIGGAAVFASLVLLIIVLATRGGDKTATAATTPPDKVDKKQPGEEKVTMAVTPTTQTPTQSPETQTPVTPPVTPTKAPDVVPDDEEHAVAHDPNSPPVVGSGPCKLTVTTTPAGSLVRLDDQLMGPSPITIQGACARRRVDVKHARYAPGQRWVMLAAGKPATVDIPLNRPTHAVTIITQPAGATISISGKRAGTSPTAVQMMGFTKVALTIEKKGYTTVVESIYSKSDGERRTVTLTRAK